MSRIAMCRAFAILSLAFLAIVLVIVTLPREDRAPRREPRPRDPGVTDEQAAVFAVLDDVFPYDVPRHCPFVEVQFGWPERVDDELRTAPWANPTRHGFLLADGERRFAVLFLDGERAVLQRTSAHTPRTRRNGHRVVDLHEHALALARERGRFPGPRHGVPISPWTRALLAARALVRRGRVDEAASVWRELPEDARSLRDRCTVPGAVGHGSWPFLSDLANRAALDLDDLSLSWGDLLERRDRYRERITASYIAPERLDQIAHQLDEGGWSPWRSSAQRTLDELRDTARPVEGGWDVALLLRFVPDPAAHAAFDRIVAAGLDRVPDLIAALDDRSPTRSVFYHHGKGGVYIGARDVRGIATEALRILHGGGEPVDDWSDWHARVQKVGLREFLAAKLRDSASAPDAAESYLRLWPGDVARVLDAALATPDETWSALVGLVVPFAATDAPLRERLTAELRSALGTRSTRRAFAARALLQLGDDHGAQRLREAAGRGEVLRPAEWLVLCESGVPEVWPELEARLDEPATRRGLTHVVHVSSREEVLEFATETARSTIDAAWRRCLLRLLADASMVSGRDHDDDVGVQVVHAGRKVSLHRASHADLAAVALANGWPRGFTFEPRAPGRQRERSIRELLRNSGVEPFPPAPEAAPAPADVIGVLTFEGDPLPAAARDEVLALRGNPLDPMTAAALLRRIAVAQAKIVALHCERPGDGFGLVVRCSSRTCADSAHPHRRTHDAEFVLFTATRAGDTTQGAWSTGDALPAAHEFSFVSYP